MNGLGFITDTKTNNPIPSSMYSISTVSITEAFSPLLGLDLTLNNNMTAKLEYKTTRVVSLSTTSIQINEATSKDWVIGFGYKINNFKLFGGGGARKAKGNDKKGGTKEDDNNQKSKTATNNKNKSGFNTDLNLRLDISFRNQAAITRDISTRTSTASSGNDATKISFSADYALSRLLSMSLYYDFQKNTPLLTTSSYPTSTHDFGVSIKFSLTR